MINMKKVLVLGSGSLKIGEAGEFDYSGSQCLKALREEGIETVLVNPNIATIQTSEGMADKIYFLPVTPYFVERVIEKEKPDGILLSFGGQTALNCGVKLFDSGALEKHNIRVLGTQIEAIKKTEDRELFIQTLKEINCKTAESKAVISFQEARDVANNLGFPVMVRIAYALGGQGSGVAYTEDELQRITEKSFAFSSQALIEKYLGGWKEIEYEVVRDAYDNCITVCNMENVDPMGIHTGESIVVAPSQTLSSREYFMLRDIATRVIRHLGIVGECNIQYALDPNSEDYRIIEVNARLSRSSALASKATGYPLAFVAAKLGLGYSLIEIENKITKATKSCFEPSLDYCVVKFPRWDLQKFRNVNPEIGSAMKSVGEVMAIGRKFEEALQKAIRMLNVNMHGLVANSVSFDDVEKELTSPTDKRMFAVVEALRIGISVERIHELTKIDKWFLFKIKNVVDTESQLRSETFETLSKELLMQAKQQGFSDFQIARCLFRYRSGTLENELLEVRNKRKQLGILPCVKQIDTLAGEFPAKTNYLYLTYNGEEDDVEFTAEKNVVVLGSGAYRIGSSVEFDWCCVNAVQTLKQSGYTTTMLNCNPETVSTDYDICDRLYFDELTFERVMDIYEKENPSGIIVSMGGQVPNNLAMRLHKQNVTILGTSPLDIDRAENRHKFSVMLDSLHVDQPQWLEAKSIEEAERFAEQVEYPVLIRPSYVLSGAAMSVAVNKNELDIFLQKAASVSKEHPVVISKFITDAKEIEIDAVAQNGELILYALSEHIENAGVHSGDATMLLPPQYLYLETVRKIKLITKKIANALHITGPFNIQFIAKENQIKVIECNLRASRSFPFVSKVTKHNFIEFATKAMLGIDIRGRYYTLDLDYVGVKAPQFSFSRLPGADPVLSVEMASTGEVGCLGNDVHEAFLKSLLSVGYTFPNKNILLSLGHIKNKANLLASVHQLVEMHFNLFATEGSAKFLKENGIETTLLHWPLDKNEPNVLTYLQQRSIDIVINIPKNYSDIELNNDYIIRRKAIDLNIPLLTNTLITKLFIDSLAKKSIEDLEIKEWNEY